jgi:hypothetical protein
VRLVPRMRSLDRVRDVLVLTLAVAAVVVALGIRPLCCSVPARSSSSPMSR